mmetsp:Transcript_55463/g.179882  ORF Transcript_55463/g.179882 Transcript_55463/m.179882 type:complete len:359 (-) Transcript_55463:33-1109(-)
MATVLAARSPRPQRRAASSEITNPDSGKTIAPTCACQQSAPPSNNAAEFAAPPATKSSVAQIPTGGQNGDARRAMPGKRPAQQIPKVRGVSTNAAVDFSTARLSTGKVPPSNNRVSAGVANTPKRVVLKVSTTDKAASPLAKNAHKLDAWPPLTLPSSTSPAFVDKSSTLPAAEKYGACNHSPMITASSGIKPKQHKAFKARAPGDCTALPRSWGFNDRPIANINKPSPRWKAAGVPSAAHVTGKRTPKPAATKVQRGKNLVKLANHFASPEPPAPAAAARPASASLPRKGDERIRDRAYAQPGRRLSPRSHRCPAPPARKLPPATKCTRLCSRIAGPSAMRPPAKALVRISAIEVDR